MSQWFGGPGRKSGKTPDGAPDDSASMSRGPATGKFGRPAPRNQQSKPQLEQPAQPPQTSAQPQAPRPQSNPADWQPNRQSASPPPPPPPAPTPAPRAQQLPSYQPSQAPPGQVPYGQPQYGQASQPMQPGQPQPYQNPQPQSRHQTTFGQSSAAPAPRPNQAPPPPPPPPQPERYPQSQYPVQQAQQQESQRPATRQPQYEQYEDYRDQSDSYGEYQDDTQDSEADITSERVEFKKRVVALIIDFLVCYLLAMGVMLIPYVNSFVSLELVMSCFLLVRDYAFEGRGIGKNLMGLQVVDDASGDPCSLKQSLIRNIVLIAPYALTQIITAVLRLVPYPTVNQIITNINWGICGLYVLVVFPMEVYRSYSRSDGLRFGDELAGTAVVESAMDFSKPLPRR